MAKNDILTAAFNLPPEKAIEYFKSKGYQISFDWHDMLQDAHTKAFTVAGVTSLDVLVDIRKAVETAQRTGKSLESFKQELKPLLKKKGWLGKKTITRPDGSSKEVDLSQPWRLKTIYQTNMQTAYMAGRYKGMMDVVETRPYWRYVAVMDGRTRDEHRRLHGKILRYDDPFWDKYFPPNGWGCRCRIVSVSKFEADKKGLEIIKGEDMAPAAALTVPPEWQYNPGKSFWKPDTKKYSGWERKKVEEIVAKANEFKNNVEFVKNVDYNNEKEILSALREQEKIIVSQDFESAVVVTKTGEVFKVNGDSKFVHPEVLGDLKGAYVTHNHTANETEYSFSEDDFELFRDSGLKVLRGADVKYVYELTRLNNVMDDCEDYSVKILNPENYRHSWIQMRAKQNGFGYKRKNR
ncbi:MAG: phage minor head protein [Pusillimonas sp.]